MEELKRKKEDEEKKVLSFAFSHKDSKFRERKRNLRGKKEEYLSAEMV